MGRETSWSWALLWLGVACGDPATPTALSGSPTAVRAPAALATPNAAPPRGSPNPCDSAAPIKLELHAGVSQKTPWDLELRYVIDEDKELGAGYTFQLRSGDRRWETRRDHRNWRRPLTWRGFCWRVAERPPQRALKIAVEVAPVCKDGKLQELGGCGSVLDPS